MGEQLARALAGAGATPVLAARRAQLQREVPRADTVACDVTDPADRARLVETVMDRHGRLDGLVNTGSADRRISLRFLRSPVQVLGDGDGPVTGLRVARNRLEDGRAVPTGEEEEVIPCGLVIRSIGYRGRPLPGVPFDERRGLIRNAGGRVCEEDGTPRPREYAVGWIRRGRRA